MSGLSPVALWRLISKTKSSPDSVAVLMNHEGVIKFDLDFQLGPAPDAGLLLELNAWRQIFRSLGLLGQSPDLYEDFSFGNLSRRLPGHNEDRFLISGTQTGQFDQLKPEDYVEVILDAPVSNFVRACGPVKPSSESLSHAAAYLADPAINWVMHLHSPDIFKQAYRLGLPATDPSVAYGTPEMADQIAKLVQGLDSVKPHLIIMSGHDDGVLAFGPNVHTVGTLVVKTLAMAFIESSH